RNDPRFYSCRTSYRATHHLLAVPSLTSPIRPYRVDQDLPKPRHQPTRAIAEKTLARGEPRRVCGKNHWISCKRTDRPRAVSLLAHNRRCWFEIREFPKVKHDRLRNRNL